MKMFGMVASVLGTIAGASFGPGEVSAALNPSGRDPKSHVPAPVTARPMMRKAKAQAYGERGSRSKKERMRRRETRRQRAVTRRAR